MVASFLPSLSTQDQKKANWLKVFAGLDQIEKICIEFMLMGARIEEKVVLNSGQIEGAKVSKQLGARPCLDGFHILNSVVELGQLPITEFKVASQPTTVSGFFLLSLAFY